MCFKFRKLLSFLNIQVSVAVNVQTKANIQFISMKSNAAPARQPLMQLNSNTKQKQNQKQLQQRSRRKPGGGGGGNGSLSTILMINSLLLLLLSLCCDVCKSNEYPTPAPPHPHPQPHQHHSLTTTTTLTPPSPSHITAVDFVELLEAITRKGLQRCIAEEEIFQDEFGIKCDIGDTNEKCYRTRCIKGYEQWWRALKEYEPCQEACASTQFHPYDLPCISACETAQRQYWRAQRRTMESMVRSTKPHLVINGDDTNTDTMVMPMRSSSLQIKWPIVFPDNYELAHLASRPFNIQYQYANEEGAGAAVGESNETLTTTNSNEIEEIWSNLADYNCNEDFDCEILERLAAYTNYRFRFELPFGDYAEDVLYSPPTEVYKTPASGPPISKPDIHLILPLDDSHVAIFWHKPKFTNGLLQAYKLVLYKDNDTREETLPADIEHHVIHLLQSASNYSLSLAAINDEGEGPSYETFIITKDIPKSSINLENLEDVLIVGDYSIESKTFGRFGDSRTVFQSTVLLSDYGLHLAQQRLFVIDSRGTLYSLFLNNTSERVVIPMDHLNFKPRKLSIDWVNQRLVIAGETSRKTWFISSYDFNGKNEVELVNNFPTTIHQLEVDPFNGWLFWTHSIGISRLDIATKEIKTIQRNNDNSEIGYFTNDYRRYLLTVYNKTDDKLYELSYDGAYYGPVQTTILNSSARTQLLHGELQSFHFDYESNLLVANNGTHLMRQNYRTNENDIWEIRELEWCWHIWPLQMPQQYQQPLAATLQSPQRLLAVLDAHKAHISWIPPALVPYQSVKGAWQHWEYELEIMDVASNSAFNIRNIQTTFFNVERLQANNLYKMRVRVTSTNTNQQQQQQPQRSNQLGSAANGANSAEESGYGYGGSSSGGDGPWSEELLTRTWPLGEHKLLWLHQAEEGDKAAERGVNIYETNEMGSQVVLLRQLVGVGHVRDFIQLNGTIYYLTEAPERRLACANIMNPEVNCSLTALNANSLAYDWRGGRLYWTDVLRNCVVRATLDGSELEMLPILGAQYIKLDAYNGYIYYMTTTKLARRTLSGSRLDIADELEYFHVNGGFGGQMRGFALDLTRQQIYWIVRQNEGRVRLFKMALSQHQKQHQQEGKLIDKLLDHDIVFGSLEYLRDIESLMWLKRESKTAVLMHTDKLKEQGLIVVDEIGTKVKAVRLKRDIVPYIDESVIPEAVNVTSIRIEDGFWDDFNVKWAPISAADNFTVFYKIILEYGTDEQKEIHTREVVEPLIRITELNKPETILNISITPHTYWRAGPTSAKELSTPAAAPTQPKRLRVFVESIEKPLQVSPNVTALIRWDAPENVSLNSVVAYKVFCWSGEELHSERLHNISNGKPLEAVVDNLRIGETYTFQVQAFATGRANGGEKTAVYSLNINPEVQAVPRLLLATSEHIALLDMDLRTQKILAHTNSAVEHLATMHGEQRLLWVNENVELMSFVPGSSPIKLARMRAEVLALTVDWISRIVYWAEMATEVEQAVSIYKLDLCQFEGRVKLGTKLLTTGRGRLIRDLAVLPFSQTLIWLEFELGTRNATLVGRNLTDLSALKFKQYLGLRHMFAGASTPDMETMNLFDHRQRACVFDVQRQICTPLKTSGMLEDSMIIERDNGFIYVLKNETIRAYNRRKQNLEYVQEVNDVQRIKALNYQAYPERKCLLPEEERLSNYSKLLRPEFIGTDEDFVTLRLPPVNTYPECHLPLPGLKYELHLTDKNNNTKNYTTYGEIFNMTELKPFTNYSFTLTVSSYYQQKLGLPLLKSDRLKFCTAPGSPSRPQNFTAYALSPTEIEVAWAAPELLNCAAVWYELHWQMGNSSLVAHKRLEREGVHTLSNLAANQLYSVWLKVYSTSNKFNSSEAIEVRTFEQPNPLQLVEQTAHNLTLSWMPSTDVVSILLVCRSLNSAEVNELSFNITSNTTQIMVTELEPKTRYEIFLELSYEGAPRPYLWPELFNERYIYETLADCPSKPGKPQIEHITGEIFKVFWEPARENGSPIIEYSLEALQSRGPRRVRRDAGDNPSNLTNNTIVRLLSKMLYAEEPHPLEDKWLVHCNTSELSCIVREMHTQRLVMFRVRARNVAKGWGPYSQDSERVSEPYVSPEKRDSLIFAIIAPAAIVSSFVIALVVIRMIQQRRLKAKKLLEKSRPSIWSTLSTLQQQQMMTSRNRTFSIASHSTMYTGGPLSDADIALLPHISWNQMTLLKFLGSGAFGEVYEGLVKHENDDEPEKVAIKSLRKGSNEFAELLQEAQLMSNFKHENIVRLIGVCFDKDFISIIMEHMEGGDLLSYLRESRPNSMKPVASLQLLDLMTMCIDVASGCCYLEDMHFVHRDLACRNCLVSSRVPSKRTVKIGDFGLARDIYKNDYYRKEGEGLLPVRWMSPESLVDGVFTTQSDVWAFGVLCWEILTLGQQPYAARNNFEVLNYVKDGGRLEQPDNCPDKFFQLLLECWHTEPDERPSFRKCLNMLLAIKTDVRRVSLGYNIDDSDYAMYANQHGIYMSTFLSRPLPKVEEESIEAESKTNVDSDTLLSVEPASNEKAELRVHFEEARISKENGFETASCDQSQLIECNEVGKMKEEHKEDIGNENIYANEGVSRL